MNNYDYYEQQGGRNRGGGRGGGQEMRDRDEYGRMRMDDERGYQQQRTDRDDDRWQRSYGGGGRMEGRYEGSRFQGAGRDDYEGQGRYDRFDRGGSGGGGQRGWDRDRDDYARFTSSSDDYGYRSRGGQQSWDRDRERERDERSRFMTESDQRGRYDRGYGGGMRSGGGGGDYGRERDYGYSSRGWDDDNRSQQSTGYRRSEAYGNPYGSRFGSHQDRDRDERGRFMAEDDRGGGRGRSWDDDDRSYRTQQRDRDDYGRFTPEDDRGVGRSGQRRSPW